ncbi:MAG: NADH-quinone oxidoreductase subunit J [Bdellovibrionaceae bacterium]|nr:NADH-quinone oxidoreductase subunit J [Pseudobdellovibrionaceae bacterium]
MNFNNFSTGDAFFFILGFLSILFAVLTVTTPHILRAATFLMGVLCLSAGFYILLGAELLAGIQILVYVGGIVVLLVIAVMLTQNKNLGHDQAALSRKLIAFLVSGVFFAGSLFILSASPFANSPPMPSISAAASGDPVPRAGAIKDIGIALLDAGPNGFLLPFELISLLLLAVLVAGVVIARKEDQETSL